MLRDPKRRSPLERRARCASLATLVASARAATWSTHSPLRSSKWRRSWRAIALAAALECRPRPRAPALPRRSMCEVTWPHVMAQMPSGASAPSRTAHAGPSGRVLRGLTWLRAMAWASSGAIAPSRTARAGPRQGAMCEDTWPHVAVWMPSGIAAQQRAASAGARQQAARGSAAPDCAPDRPGAGSAKLSLESAC